MAFFQKVRFVFQISQSPNLPKRLFQKLSWTWNLNKLFTDMGGKFKFQAQDSFLEYFFERLGDLKKESHFLKKGTFTQGRASGSFWSTSLLYICSVRFFLQLAPHRTKVQNIFIRKQISLNIHTIRNGHFNQRLFWGLFDL